MIRTNTKFSSVLSTQQSALNCLCKQQAHKAISNVTSRYVVWVENYQVLGLSWWLLRLLFYHHFVPRVTATAVRAGGTISLVLLCCSRSWHADGVTFHLISLGHTWTSLPRKGNKINAELTTPSGGSYLKKSVANLH